MEGGTVIDTRGTRDQGATGRAIRIGTRGSALALWQANAVRDALVAAHRNAEFALRIIRPEGDIDKTSPLTVIGGRGVFASALQSQLLDGDVDLAVHSAKDVPTLSPAGLAIVAFPQREDARDAVVSRHGVGLADLPAAPRIGTSSRRRAVQIRALRPDAEIVDLRGNIDTRLRKSAMETFDAVILAAAGLLRMGWADRITTYLTIEECVPSPGQGALAIEARTTPDPAATVAGILDVPAVAAAIRLEREFLRQIGGGCTTPVGAHAELETVHGRSLVRFWGMLASDDGARLERTYDEFDLDDAEYEVARLARRMMHATMSRPTPGFPASRRMSGRSVLTTGTPRLAADLATAFRALGATCVHVPVIEIVEAPNRESHALVETSIPMWAVVTSTNAVPALSDLLENLDPESRPRVAAVGMKTVERLAAAGIVADLVPRDQRVAGLIAALAEVDLRGQRVAVLLGDRAGDELEQALDAAGAIVDRIEAYRTVTLDAIDPAARAHVRAGHFDVVTFASPSAATGLRTLLGADFPALSGACMVAIGPTTAATMRNEGIPVHAIASSPSAQGLAAATERYFDGTDEVSSGKDEEERA